MKSQLEQELNRLAKFLKTFTRRLQELEATVQQSTSSHDESIQNTDKLSRSMHQKIFGIRDEFDEHEDLDALKTTINAHLDVIDKSLAEFSEEERQRHSQARDTVQNMVVKLRDLEDETQRLRDDLQEQHATVLIDPLTNLLNRAGYDEHVAKTFARWHRYGGSLSLAFLDIDRFKQINDAYGHAAGDNVLINVANQLAVQIREADILCRYGGEEFLLILPETGLNGAIKLADKLRDNLETDCNFHFRDVPVPVTVSCGIAEFQRGDTPQQVFERADRAMYLAKRRGRNQCCSERELQVDGG